MATEQTGGSKGSSGFLYFAVGALIVAVGVLGYFYFNSQATTSPSETAIERSADAIGDAADKIGDSVGDAARNVNPPPSPAPQPVQPAAPAVPPS